MRGKEQGLFVPVNLPLTLAFSPIRKTSMRRPPVKGPAFIQERFVFLVIAGKHNPVSLEGAAFPAPFPDIIRHGRGFFGIDLGVTVAFHWVVRWIEEDPADAPVILPVAATYAGPVSAHDPDPSQALAELPEPFVQAGGVGSTGIEQGIWFCRQSGFVDAVSTRGPITGTPANTSFVVRERDLG